MPTSRKQKKARKSRGLEILSDIENLNVMLGENHFNETERDDSFDGTSIRRQESVISDNLENEGMNPYSNHRNLELGPVPITAKIQQAQIPRLRSIDCRVN